MRDEERLQRNMDTKNFIELRDMINYTLVNKRVNGGYVHKEALKSLKDQVKFLANSYD